MIQSQISAILNLNFDKWKAVTLYGSHRVEFRVKGPVVNSAMGQMECFRPVGVEFHFYTMGFFESLFCFKNKWK